MTFWDFGQLIAPFATFSDPALRWALYDLKNATFFVMILRKINCPNFTRRIGNFENQPALAFVMWIVFMGLSNNELSVDAFLAHLWQGWPFERGPALLVFKLPFSSLGARFPDFIFRFDASHERIMGQIRFSFQWDT
jgi:hypothetical protein